MKNQKQFTVTACRWHEGFNTYHSVRITRHLDGKVISSGKTPIYGYESAYERTALKLMVDNKFIQPYDHKNSYLFERENNYPIIWNVSDGLKRDLIANGEL